jgi:hypothetical protein
MAEHTLQSIAFPILDADQIAQLANCAAVAPKRYRDGETLVHVGDRLSKFFVVNQARLKSSTTPPTRRTRWPSTGQPNSQARSHS